MLRSILICSCTLQGLNVGYIHFGPVWLSMLQWSDNTWCEEHYNGLFSLASESAVTNRVVATDVTSACIQIYLSSWSGNLAVVEDSHLYIPTRRPARCTGSRNTAWLQTRIPPTDMLKWRMFVARNIRQDRVCELNLLAWSYNQLGYPHFITDPAVVVVNYSHGHWSNTSLVFQTMCHHRSLVGLSLPV